MSVSIINGNVYISNVRGGTYVSGTYNSGVQGNGELKAEPRNVESFDSVVLESSVDADVHCGHKGNQAVSVSGDSNLLDMVKTRVKDGVLHIGAEGSFSTQNPLKVKVQTDKLLSATLRASGDLAVQALNQPAFAAVIQGSGDFSASGAVDELKLTSQGSGDFSGFSLAANRADVTVQGSGDADVQVGNELKAFIAGSGDVTYKGNPSVSSQVDGSGACGLAEDLKHRTSLQNPG